MACSNPIYIDSVKDFRQRQIPVPCHHCVSCRIDSIKYWEMRLKYEYITQPSAFVTLTYDDYHLVYHNEDILNAEYNRLGVPLGVTRSKFALSAGFWPTLCHRHLSNYLIALSRKSLTKFKWFCASEYGSDRFRPHYHLLVFGLDFASHAKLFKKCWPHGSVKVLPVLHGSFRYVLKYLEKQQSPDVTDSLYFDFGVDAPSISASNHLGEGFFALHAKEIAETGFVRIGSRHVPVSSYHSNKFLHFSDSLIYNKFRISDEFARSLADTARSLGYDDVNDYINDTARARHDNLVTALRSRRQAVDPVPVMSRGLDDDAVSRLARYALDSDDGYALDIVSELTDDDVIPF